MKKSILFAIVVGAFIPVAQAAEPKKPEAPKTEKSGKATEKKPEEPKQTEADKLADAKKQADTLTAGQKTKLLELANKGDAKSIEEIKGVGPKRSKDIIAKRPYAKVEDLSNVLGEKTYADAIAFAKGEQAEPAKKETAPKKKDAKMAE